MGAVTPGETLGTLYNIHVGSNKTKQHGPIHWTLGRGLRPIRSVLSPPGPLSRYEGCPSVSRPPHSSPFWNHSLGSGDKEAS